MKIQENAIENFRKLIIKPKNYFLLSDTIFINNFRLTKDLVHYLYNLLSPFMTDSTRKFVLDIQTKMSTNLLNFRIYNHNYSKIFFCVGMFNL